MIKGIFVLLAVFGAITAAPVTQVQEDWLADVEKLVHEFAPIVGGLITTIEGRRDLQEDWVHTVEEIGKDLLPLLPGLISVLGRDVQEDWLADVEKLVHEFAPIVGGLITTIEGRRDVQDGIFDGLIKIGEDLLGLIKSSAAGVKRDDNWEAELLKIVEDLTPVIGAIVKGRRDDNWEAELLKIVEDLTPVIGAIVKGRRDDNVGPEIVKIIEDLLPVVGALVTKFTGRRDIQEDWLVEVEKVLHELGPIAAGLITAFVPDPKSTRDSVGDDIAKILRFLEPLIGIAESSFGKPATRAVQADWADYVITILGDLEGMLLPIMSKLLPTEAPGGTS